MKFCTCGHSAKQHSKIDEREWCVYGCACAKFAFALEAEDVLEAAAREAMEKFQADVKRAQRRWTWDPDAGDREWSARKDASAKGRRI